MLRFFPLFVCPLLACLLKPFAEEVGVLLPTSSNKTMSFGSPGSELSEPTSWHETEGSLTHVSRNCCAITACSSLPCPQPSISAAGCHGTATELSDSAEGRVYIPASPYQQEGLRFTSSPVNFGTIFRELLAYLA